ncbi:MAG TPA: phosphotransferase [Caballeronia sp.]|jgi:hydroxylysine kinase|nr:phosphotransferase [Caballeronia sp.]
MSIHDVLSQPSPAIDVAVARDIAIRQFGMTSSVTPLAGERDRNFHVRRDDGREYVIKFSHPAEQISIADFQAQALEHIEKVAPELPVQRVVPTLGGDRIYVHAQPAQALRVVRMFSYLPGLPLPEAEVSAGQVRSLGATLARLGLALRDFVYPAQPMKLPWDLQHAEDLTELTVHLRDPAQRALAERHLERFRDHALPILGTLAPQAIHNDLNIHNVLVAPGNHERITGILDFGDMVSAPRIIDVAVAASYQLGTGDALLTNVLEFVSAYHEVSPLKAIELEVLFDLIVARLVMIVTISGWRAALYPENAKYILRNNAVSWRRLSECDRAQRDDVLAALRHACTQPATLTR